jgi:hypothetical protein
MVAEYGMSDRLGLVTYERERRPMFLPDTFSAGKTYSEQKAAQIDEEISRIIKEAHERVRGILSQRRKVLDDLAHLLLEKEVVQGEELREMLSKSKTGIAAPLPEKPSKQLLCPQRIIPQIFPFSSLTNGSETCHSKHEELEVFAIRRPQRLLTLWSFFLARSSEISNLPIRR